MVKRSAGSMAKEKDMSVSTMGKPTEKTMAPTHDSKVSAGVMDGIVKGVARHT